MGWMATDELQQMLRTRIECTDPELREEIDRKIITRYQTRKAVLISDMARFSKTTREHGIIHFLGLIDRMQRLCLPLLEEHGGHLVKAEADNLYATFDEPRLALRAAMAMQQATANDAATRPAHDQIRLGIGIDAGEILDIDGREFWGDPVNIASKLGEDLAEAGEILLTDRTADSMQAPEGWAFEPRRGLVSGLDFGLAALVAARARSR